MKPSPTPLVHPHHVPRKPPTPSATTTTHCPLQVLYPSCFKTHEECSEDLTHAQNYLQVCGIIVGMLVVGEYELSTG